MRILSKVALCTIVAIATLEVCARVDDYLRYDAPLLEPYVLDRLYVQSAGVVRGRPLARFKDWRLNSLGLRGPELRPGTVRVMCIGASETFGMTESPGKEFPRQLEEKLRGLRPSSDIQVANLSYFGLKLSTAAALLPDVLSEVRPRVAMIYLTYGGYVARTTSNVVEEGLIRERQSVRIVSKLGELARAATPLVVQQWLRELQINRYVAGRSIREHMPPDRPGFLIEDLDRIVAVLREHGVTPVLVTHANRFSGDLGEFDRRYFLTVWRKFYPLYSEAALLEMDERLNTAARLYATDRNIALIDVAAAMPGGPALFSDHEHFTNDGAGWVASMLATQVLPLLEPVQQ